MDRRCLCVRRRREGGHKQHACSAFLAVVTSDVMGDYGMWHGHIFISSSVISGPAMPLHGPALYYMLRDWGTFSPLGCCSFAISYMPHLLTHSLDHPHVYLTVQFLLFIIQYIPHSLLVFQDIGKTHHSLSRLAKTFWFFLMSSTHVLLTLCLQ